jgi:hypothetical protein
MSLSVFFFLYFSPFINPPSIVPMLDLDFDKSLHIKNVTISLFFLFACLS